MIIRSFASKLASTWIIWLNALLLVTSAFGLPSRLDRVDALLARKRISKYNKYLNTKYYSENLISVF